MEKKKNGTISQKKYFDYCHQDINEFFKIKIINISQKKNNDDQEK